MASFVRAYAQVLISFWAVNPNRYEAILEEAWFETNGLSAAFAGAARRARMEVQANSPHEVVVRDVAASVAGPMLISFVYWTLRRADLMGLKRLYFLSRDGQVLYEIAQGLVKKWGLDIDCRYIYASRQAWGQGFHDKAVRHWVWGDVVEGTSLRNILDRLSVDPQEVLGGLSSVGYGPDRLDAELTRRDISKLRKFFDSEGFSKGIADSRERHRRTLCDYLSGVGMLDEVPKAMVDLGWTGTLHDLLSILLDSVGAAPVHAFCFGLNRRDTAWKDYRHGFYFDSTRQRGPLNPLEGKNLFVMSEVFCAADHGTVTGFERKGSAVEAVLAQGWDHQVTAWGLPLYRETIQAVVEALHLPDFRGPNIAAMRDPLGQIIQTFWTKPTVEEAEGWGSFPWDAGQGNEDKVNQLVRPYRGLKDFLWSTLLRSRAYKNNIYWVEGSLAVSPRRFQYAVRKTNRLLSNVALTQQLDRAALAFKGVERRLGNRSSVH